MKDEKIIAGVIIFLLSFIFCTTHIVQFDRLDSYREEYNNLRTQYESLKAREQQLNDTIAECRESVERTNEILSESTTTIGELRNQIIYVRECYEEMENLLFRSGLDIRYTDSDSDSKEELNEHTD